MKNLTKYEQLQFGIFIVFFLAFVTCFTLVIILPEPSDAIVEIYKELKVMFLSLLSLTTLKQAIAKDNGGKPSEDTQSVTTSTTVISG